MKYDFDPLVEGAVWGKLYSITDLELILLKGHLLLEQIVEIVLVRNNTPKIIIGHFIIKSSCCKS